MKNVKLKEILKYILIFLGLIVIFCISLTITSLIPKDAIEQKTVESVEILTRQTNRYYVPIPSKNINMMFDNYTDALMINTAYSIDTDTPFYSAMVARKNYIKGMTTTIYPDTNGELKSSSKYEELDQVGDLNDTVNNDTSESFEYARYWHGYLVLLRPLLTMFNINQIRIVIEISLVILAVVLLVKLYKKVNLSALIIFLLGMFVCDYFYMGISLQGAPIFIVMMISSIIILSEKIKEKHMPAMFLIIGMLTNFFDFLTAPLITLCIPLTIVLLLKQKNEEFNLKEILILMLKITIVWGVGYLGTWIVKWIIVDVIYDKKVIISALEQVRYRSAVKDEINYNIIMIIARMLRIVKRPVIFSFFVTFFILFAKIISADKNNVVTCSAKDFVPYLLIALIPIMWYTILANHSYKHAIFTYRNFMPITIGLAFAFINLINFRKREEKKE